MPLVTISQLRASFGLDESVPDDQLALSVSRAEEQIRAWAGDEAYADAQQASPQDALRAYALQDAVRSLAIYYALPNLSLRIAGGVAQAVSMPGGYSVSDLSPSELRRRRADYLAAARQAVRPYLIDGASLSSAGIIIRA
ncbi:MAG TPA: hypothetical protein VNQ79_15860 [Blastocatellia bacterium]|nr:hypothetical protein [Blastocatellia bacterium]